MPLNECFLSILPRLDPRQDVVAVPQDAARDEFAQGAFHAAGAARPSCVQDVRERRAGVAHEGPTGRQEASATFAAAGYEDDFGFH